MYNPFETIEAELKLIKSLLLNDQQTKKNADRQSETDELLTVQGAAKFLSVAVSTIYALISKGEIPVLKRSKRCYFLKADLINFLKDGRKKTNAEIDASADQFLIKKKRD